MGAGGAFGRYIKERNISVNEVSEKTGIAAQTIYSLINRDSNRVDINAFIKMCEAVGVSAEYFIDDVLGQSKQLHLSEEESIIIERYRKLDDSQKEMIKRMVAYGEGLKT